MSIMWECHDTTLMRNKLRERYSSAQAARILMRSGFWNSSLGRMHFKMANANLALQIPRVISVDSARA